MKRPSRFYLVIKRLIDLFGSMVGILFCFGLLWWWITIINLIVTKGHAIFAQVRVGKKGKDFKILKFRSMRYGVDEHLTSYEAKDEKELYTSFGKFLRKASLDETIQLLNIFIGQMSFIGPRPLIDKDQDHITIELRKENGSINLTPGLSGYAQTRGRTFLLPEERAKYDGYYYQHISLWFDIKIFVITILQLLGLKKNEANKS